MFASAIISGLLALSVVSASPIALTKRAEMTPTDVDILQYALTLEHLENAFYDGALSKFDDAAFKKAGFEPFVRKRFTMIAAHEKAHVDFLTMAIGANATKACEYKFPYTDPKSFAALSMVLEGVGVSAYLGAAQYITEKAYLTAAGSILTTESRHAAWVSSAVNKGAPWSGPLDTPLGLSQVYSLAAAFITSCPSTNPALPVKAFPAFTAAPATAKPGDSITTTFNSTGTSGDLFLAFYSGLSTEFAPIKDGKATIPKDLSGTVYAVVSSNGTMVTDDTTVAGPAIFIFPDTL